jgi:hypothetical protein
MENKYLTRKEILARGAFWDLTRVQGFAHDKIKKSETGRGRPSYLYLESRVEAFERGESIASELEALPKKVLIVVGELTDDHKTFLDAFDRAKPGEGLPGIDSPKAPTPRASVFNEGPRTVSVVRPIVQPARANAAPKHSPLTFPPTPKGEKPTIKLVVVDSDGKETLVPTPIVVD